MELKKLRATKRFKIVLSVVLSLLLSVGLWVGCVEYSYIFGKAVLENTNVKVTRGKTIDQVAQEMEASGAIGSAKRMLRFAQSNELMSIEVGNYDFPKGNSYRAILRAMHNGRQTPIRLTFNSFRSVETLTKAISKRTMATESEYMAVFRDDSLLTVSGFDDATLLAMFIPNTYEVYWTITPRDFFDKMLGEYHKFWNSERWRKAKRQGLKPVEVSILASIVASETNNVAEMVDIAGVYLNRLRIGMPLQADPTVKFAVGDPSIRRITRKHLKVKSPYNTYLNPGLPPGLITMPSVDAIDAVLNYDKHSYLYFCAKADMSGSHAFAQNLQEHNKNARVYASELNRRGIK